MVHSLGILWFIKLTFQVFSVPASFWMIHCRIPEEEVYVSFIRDADTTSLELPNTAVTSLLHILYTSVFVPTKTLKVGKIHIHKLSNPLICSSYLNGLPQNWHKCFPWFYMKSSFPLHA